MPAPEFYQHKNSKTERNRNLTHFFRYLSPYKWQLGQTAIAMLLFMVIGLIFPFLTQAIVDVGIRNSNLNFVVLVLAAQLILTFTNLSIGFLQNWISLHVNTRIDISLISDFLIKLMKLPIRFFDTKLTGDIIQRLGDHARIENFLIGNSMSIVFSCISFVLYTCLLGYYDVTLLWIFLIGHSLYVGWIVLFLRYRKQLDYKAFELQAKNRSKIIQLVQGMQEIKLQNDEKRKRWEWEQIQIKLFHNNIRGLKIDQIQSFGATLITQSTGLIISFLVAKEVIEGGMTLGMMMALSYVIGQVGAAISQFIGYIHAWQDAQISLERLNEIHNQKDEDTIAAEQQPSLPTERNVDFDNVSFSYDGSQRTYVLRDITLHIPRNKVTALVGASGSGKTTLMKMLQGFYEPQVGNVKIGGVVLSSINPHTWRSHVGSVMQDGYIFSDTIAGNIMVGSEKQDSKRLEQAAKMANIHDFIVSLPLGYNTVIGMEGNGISQGQKQRILIARAIYKSPDYVLFDEATNALDSNNEKIIMDNLADFYKGRTVVIAAHRLSTIRRADQIVVLKDGKIAEMGTHDELLKREGEYYQLVKTQLDSLE